MENRMIYFAALEEASVHQNIVPFTQFIGKCMEMPKASRDKEGS